MLVLIGIELTVYITEKCCFQHKHRQRDALAVTEQGLHSDQTYFLLLTPPQQRVDWGCMRNWEGTAGPNGPMG